MSESVFLESIGFGWRKTDRKIVIVHKNEL